MKRSLFATPACDLYICQQLGHISSKISDAECVCRYSFYLFIIITLGLESRRPSLDTDTYECIQMNKMSKTSECGTLIFEIETYRG